MISFDMDPALTSYENHTLSKESKDYLDVPCGFLHGDSTSKSEAAIPSHTSEGGREDILIAERDRVGGGRHEVDGRFGSAISREISERA